MSRLPIFKDDNKNLMMLQNRWASELNPILANPMTSPLILKGISLVSGDNIINTRLGRKMQGWVITDVDSAVQVYRSAALNNLTLTLNSSGSATIDLMVF